MCENVKIIDTLEIIVASDHMTKMAAMPIYGINT